MDVLNDIHKYDDSLPVIMITDYSSVDTAVEAINHGAFDYIYKNPNMKELKLLVKKSLRQRKIAFQARVLLEDNQKGFYNIVGNSPAMKSQQQYHFRSRIPLPCHLVRQSFLSETGLRCYPSR